MAWYHRVPAPKLPPEQRKSRMEGLWIKCDGCGEIIYKQDVEKNLEVCPKCDEHFPFPVRRRLDLVLDPGTFVEHDLGLESTDPLQFSDSKKYKDRIKSSQKSSGEGDAFLSGLGRVAGREVSVGAFHFGFMGGSMGSVVGEKVTRVFERATDRRVPAIVFSASGGARMQEAIFSLMQMAKSSAAIARFRQVQKPYISVLLDPTTGGVAASFAFTGDIILAEPKALIGFAGPRVIEQTIRQKLPEGFQRSEFLLEHGMIDLVVERRELRPTLSHLLRLYQGVASYREARARQ
jgi:acetyl-CoA carboxylase carboxyl transferase subunit beta